MRELRCGRAETTVLSGASGQSIGAVPLMRMPSLAIRPAIFSNTVDFPIPDGPVRAMASPGPNSVFSPLRSSARSGPADGIAKRRRLPVCDRVRRPHAIGSPNHAPKVGNTPSKRHHGFRKRQRNKEPDHCDCRSDSLRFQKPWRPQGTRPWPRLRPGSRSEVRPCVRHDPAPAPHGGRSRPRQAKQASRDGSFPARMSASRSRIMSIVPRRSA